MNAHPKHTHGAVASIEGHAKNGPKHKKVEVAGQEHGQESGFMKKRMVLPGETKAKKPHGGY